MSTPPRMKRPPSSPRLRGADLSARGARFKTLKRADEVHLTYSGRAGIYQYLARLRTREGGKRNTVMVPSFHCPTVVDPALHAGYDVRFYAVDTEMRVSTQDFLAKLDGDVAAVLFVAFFGFSELDPALVAACRERGVRVIEDCAHSFLSWNPLRLADHGADATIYSFWKLVPSAVGGGVLPTAALDGMLWPAQNRSSLRDSFGRVKRLVREVVEESREAKQANPAPSTSQETPKPAVRKPSEEAYPYLPAVSKWGMPLSANVVLSRADLDPVASIRRRNYEILATGLAPSREVIPLRPDLPSDTVPWGFAIRLSKRPERDYLIRAQGVPVFTFGETLHPLMFERHANEQSMLDAAVSLRDSTLALSIHQGLSEAQMKTVVAIVNDSASRWAAEHA